jgi:predicted DNA-binding protein
MDKLDKVIPVRFTEEQWQKIKLSAQEQGRTASDLVRWIVMAYIETTKKDTDGRTS